MPKRPQDRNQLAKFIVDKATGQEEMPESRCAEVQDNIFKDDDGGWKELILTFCRECLEWPEASLTDKCVVENMERPELSNAYGKMHGFLFNPNDFGDVLNAVREWCDIHAVTFYLKYSPESQEDVWSVRFAPHAEARGTGLCQLFLHECLEADRAMRKVGLKTILTSRNLGILSNPWGNRRENGHSALAFCIEVMGWKNAHLIDDFGYLYICESVPRHLAKTPIPPRERSFHFNENHVDKVIDEVKKWCDANMTPFVLEYFPSGSAGDCWNASFGGDAESNNELASAALMSGCLKAHQKLMAMTRLS